MSVPVLAQSSASLVNAGYSKPAPFLVAPGQLMTLFFRGLGPLSSSADLSLSISQSGNTLKVPLLSMTQDKDDVTGLRVQIPFELLASTTPRLGPKGVQVPDVELTLLQNGQPSRTFPLRPVSENGHVLTSCDLSGDTNPDTVCTRTAYHADGRPVGIEFPAAKGETVIVYAYGLGQTDPPAATADVSPAGRSILDPQEPRILVTVQDQFLNANPAVPRNFVSEAFNYPAARVEFAGLAPGQLGLYQLNVVVPSTFQVDFRCGPDEAIGSIRSNGFFWVTTAQGSELVPLCVQ
jgi:uncharacterized protein (TIGR03437 family)